MIVYVDHQDVEEVPRNRLREIRGWVAYEWRYVTTDEMKLCARLQNQLPVPIGEIAHALGLRLIASSLPYDISGKLEYEAEPAESFTIKVNRDENRFRQRFTVAHEIAHFLLHRNEIRDGGGLTDSIMYRSRLSDALEAQANRVAADLLMPNRLIREYCQREFGFEIPTDAVIPHISNAINVSKVALQIRYNLV